MNRQGFEPPPSASETGAINTRPKYYTETLAIKTKTRQISHLNMHKYISGKKSAGSRRFVIFRPYLNMEGKSSTQHERFFHAYLSIVPGGIWTIVNLKFFVTKSLQICRRMRLK